MTFLSAPVSSASQGPQPELCQHLQSHNLLPASHKPGGSVFLTPSPGLLFNGARMREDPPQTVLDPKPSQDVHLPAPPPHAPVLCTCSRRSGRGPSSQTRTCPHVALRGALWGPSSGGPSPAITPAGPSAASGSPPAPPCGHHMALRCPQPSGTIYRIKNLLGVCASPARLQAHGRQDAAAAQGSWRAPHAEQWLDA